MNWLWDGYFAWGKMTLQSCRGKITAVASIRPALACFRTSAWQLLPP
ncbi:hypothetical protein [Burkholderia glumae]|nr:hypothetical protein [Burkholderia glumae]QJW78789.1 hypothetical protein GAS18_08470 [Burkholderia glumae]